MHLILVEDDLLIASGLLAGLRLHGFKVHHAETVDAAAGAMAAASFDAAVLDLGLPDGDGLELLARWRARGQHMPVLVLTARDAVSDRVRGLKSGADDYLLKPFDLEELVARLHALLRRAAGRGTDRVEHGAVSFDPASGQTWLSGKEMDLSRRERVLLATLLQHPRQTLSVVQLRDRLYGMEQDVESNAVNVHIHHLRRKLGSGIVETVRGVGYRLGAP